MSDASDQKQAVEPIRMEAPPRLSSPYSELSRCPQCGTAKPTLKYVTTMFKRQVVSISAGNAWAVFQCTSCENPINFLTLMEQFSTANEQMVYIMGSRPVILDMQPKGQEDFSHWPSRARRFIEQAIETLHSPDAAVLMAGSAVDAMLKEKGYLKDSVYKRIEQAVSDHLLTVDMGEWAHSVRLAANNPRHADIDDPHATLEQASASIDFVKALGLILFVLPARIERGRKVAAQNKS